MATNQKMLAELSKLDSDARNNILMESSVENVSKRIFDEISGKQTTLKLKDIYVEKKNDNADISAQKRVRNRQQIWGDNLRGNFELIDNASGQVIDKVDGLKMADIPKMTNRGTYMIGGNEFQFTKQSRLKSGIYTAPQANGEISSFINVDKTVDFDRGFNNNAKIIFKPDKKAFIMKYGQKNVPLINAMRSMGVSDAQMTKQWGKDVFDANNALYGSDKKQQINENKLYEAVFNRQPEKNKSSEVIRREIRERLLDTKLNPEVNKITLGRGYDKISSEPLLAASKKIIDIHSGKADGDDKESPIFKAFTSEEDHIREKLIKNAKKIQQNVKFKIDKHRSIKKSLSADTLNPYIQGTLTGSQLSNPPNQVNIMSILGEDSKITAMGEGGIGSSNAITNDMRKISDASAGFIDPLHTPEGGGIGIAVHSTMGSFKVGDSLYSPFVDKSGKKVMMNPTQVYDKVVAFPDEFDTMTKGSPKALKKKVMAIQKGEQKVVDASKVDLVIDSQTNLFDTSVNNIPFLDSIQQNRGLTASKMQEQARSIKNRDKPLFTIMDKKGNNISKITGEAIGIPKSTVSGTVRSIEPGKIVVEDAKGKGHVVQMYDNFSLNAESFLHNTPIVKVGDTVKKGQALADNNFTKDGHVAIGVNARVAYMPSHGYQYEDSTKVSESFAKKATSEHMYDVKTKRSSTGVINKNKFKAYYPEALTDKNARKLDADGVVKVGQRVESGDVLIAHMEKRIPTADDIALGKLDKQLVRDFGNDSLTWENDHVGTVTGVEKHGNSVVVNVKTEEPLKVADKLSGLHGNKHIVSQILPDDQMPYNAKTGQHMEVIMSPIGVSNRMNASQTLENAAGKIAEKTGKPYKIVNFSGQNNAKKVSDDLKKVGLTHSDTLIDPISGEILTPQANGISHLLKLEHVVDHKFSARYRDGHDANEQAVSGGHKGGKNIGRMEMAAMMARNVPENLREMFNVKGQRNDEYWEALETNQTLPPPKKTFVWDKMRSMMHGAGINVEQRGKNGRNIKMLPMTDKNILEMSTGKLTRPDKTYRKKNLEPIKGGLFDPQLAGGMQGNNYTHFELPEKVLNPIAAKAAASITGVTQKKLEGIIAGDEFVDKKGNIVPEGTVGAISGSPAIERMLKRVDVDRDLKQAENDAIKTNNTTKLNGLNRKIRYLKNLKNENLKPEDYMVKNVLVTPSKFRPMFSMGTEGTVIMSDINDLYQQAATTASTVKEHKDELKSLDMGDDFVNEQMKSARGALYNDVKAIVGTGDPTSYLNRVKNKKGFVKLIDGGEKQTKTGFFQDKVLERRQDLVGRSTIILNPDLSGDELGVPKKMAKEMFQPFIMSKMVSMGYSPLEAKQNIKEENNAFVKARDLVAKERLVIANRAPTLHKWNMTAFKPVLTDGKSIEVPAVVVAKNFGGDFDGDTFQLHTPVSQKALEEAKTMLPSKNMLKTGYDSVLNVPAMGMVAGSYLFSQGKGGKDTDLKFKSVEEAEKSYKANKFTAADNVTINGRKARYGIHALNEGIDPKLQKWDTVLDSKASESWIRDVTKKQDGESALKLADKIKRYGNDYITKHGLTFSVDDMIIDNNIRRDVLKKAENRLKNKKDVKSEDIIEVVNDAKNEGMDALAKKHGNFSNIGIPIASGAGKGIANTAAITLMQGVLMDADDNPIDMPVLKSFGEGLSTGEYWTGSKGARGGNIKKSVSSFKPGWLTKDIINSMYLTRINGDKPMDGTGIEYGIDDKKAISNRFLARDVKNSAGKVIAKQNDLIDSKLLNKMNSAGAKSVFVQSPLTDPTPGDGFSSWSYGVDYKGQRHNTGDNIGIEAAHTITEPALNMAMKSFHTGGAFKKKGAVGTVFDRLDRTLKFAQNPADKATFAALDGVIEDVQKSSIGGWDVTVSDGNKRESRYVSPINDLKFKKGDTVKKGDLLSTGTATAHDMLKYRGMKATQRYLVDEISDISEGKLDHNNIETIVRGITNTTRVLNPGSSKSYSAGDTAPLTTIEHYNRNNLKEEKVEDSVGDHLAEDYGMFRRGRKIDNSMVQSLIKSGVNRINVHKDRIKHEPFLIPTGISAKASSNQDVIGRLAHNRLKTVLEDSAMQGWESEIGGEHPLAELVAGSGMRVN